MNVNEMFCFYKNVQDAVFPLLPKKSRSKKDMFCLKVEALFKIQFILNF